MRTALRLSLGLIAALAAARAACFVLYAAETLPAPFESYSLEGKMAHLAWRVQAGLPLYPDWQHYPHVCNFFGPLYWLVVGGLGRASGAGLEGLFVIGRGVSFASALLTAGAVGWAVGLRHGRASGAVAGLLTLGAAPLFGVAAMVRPDVSAELLGVAGFLLAGRRSPRLAVVGGVLLVLAMLTKQTAGVFLLARGVALAASGRPRAAAAVVLGCLGGLAAVVAAVTLSVEPHFARSLLGESKTPADPGNWLYLVRRLLWFGPDLLAIPALGLLLWPRERPRDLDAIVLTLVLLAATFATALKQGADWNYFIGLRLAEAMAVGALWGASRSSPSAALLGAALVGAASLVPSTLFAGLQARLAVNTAAGRPETAAATAGQAAAFREAMRLASDPALHILTDSSLVDAYQRERAVFGDPYLFRIQVETGQVVPAALERRIELERYDYLITQRALEAPEYGRDPFGLPPTLAERARLHYELDPERLRFAPAGPGGGLYFYRPRGGPPAARDAPAAAGPPPRGPRDPAV